MEFTIVGDITGTETIASARNRELPRLRKRYGKGKCESAKDLLKCA